MFRSANELQGYRILATDGECGTLQDLLFDDAARIVRYIVAETGGWFSSKRVLISPVAVGEPDWDSHALPTVLSRKNIQDSPGIETERPVTRQSEIELAAHYNWPAYWGFGTPGTVVNGGNGEIAAKGVPQTDGEPHLQSTREVAGYHVECMEGELGHVDDLIVDTETWALRYLVISTRNWLPGKKVMVAFDWITHITWADRKAHVDLTHQQLENAPEFDPGLPVNRAYEQRLYDFYGRPSYW